mgnify:CR=1 FL=1
MSASTESLDALLGRAALPDHLPFVTGSIGLLGTRPSDLMMQTCDTLFMIGSSFPYSEWLPKEGQARGIQIEFADRHVVVDAGDPGNGVDDRRDGVDADRFLRVLSPEHAVPATFTADVIEPYVAAHASGRTPNPCIECNLCVASCPTEAIRADGHPDGDDDPQAFCSEVAATIAQLPDDPFQALQSRDAERWPLSEAAARLCASFDTPRPSGL